MREGSTKLFGVGLHFIFARFVKSAEIVLCLSAWHKIEKLLCVSVPRNNKKRSEIVATYESFTRIATVTRLRLDLWSRETQTRVSSPSALQVVTLQQATTRQLVSVSGSGSAFSAG